MPPAVNAPPPEERRPRAAHPGPADPGPVDRGSVRDRLLDAALEVLEREGPSAVTVRVVARRAGLSDGVLYNYFADLDELIATALIRWYASPPDAVEQPPDGQEESVEDGVVRRLQPLLASHRVVIEALTSLPGRPGLRHRLGSGVRALNDAGGQPGQAVAGYLAQAREGGRLRPDTDVSALSRVLVLAFVGLALSDHVDGQPGTDTDEVLRSIVGTVLAGHLIE